MKSGNRPPQALIAAMVADVLDLGEISQKRLDQAIRRHLAGTQYRFPRVAELVKAYRDQAKTRPNVELERLLRCKTVRTDSGVAPVTLLTKPYACPGKCVYCPTEARMPKSYVASEPAAARALRLKFDPWRQVWERVQTLERNGHDAKKIELIIKGGTWSAYPWAYRAWFVKRCFDAANQLGQKKRKRYSTLAASKRRMSRRRIASSASRLKRVRIGSRRRRSSACASSAVRALSLACKRRTTRFWR